MAKKKGSYTVTVRHVTKHGDPHRRAWKEAERLDVSRCFYCRGRFRDPHRPPTMDHVNPKSLGGKLTDGWVICCQTCNSARGSVPFGVYMEFVEGERILATMEKREYRRPKRRLVSGAWVLTTLTPGQIKAVEEARLALAAAEFQFIEPSDLAADKRWDRESLDRKASNG